jgi:hypothetical protein
MTTQASRLVCAAGLCAIVVLDACASHAETIEQGSTPPQVDAFTAYAAATLHLPENHIDGGPTNEAEALLVPQHVGAIWAMTMFHVFEPEIEVRGWAAPDGTVISLGQNLGLLLVEAGVWGTGVMPALTAGQIADRLVWSLGRNRQVFIDPALGAPAPEITLSDGAGTMTFVSDAGSSGGSHDRTRFDIALTRDHGATVTRTAWPPPGAP